MPTEPKDAMTVGHHVRLFRNGRNQALRIIGAHDMLIAAHARTLDAVCLTDNVGEFNRIPALKVEN